MAQQQEQLTHEHSFFDEASAVMNAPYWRAPKANNPDELITFWEKKNQERATLSKALETASTYGELIGPAKLIYDAAKKSLDEEPEQNT